MGLGMQCAWPISLPGPASMTATTSSASDNRTSACRKNIKSNLRINLPLPTMR